MADADWAAVFERQTARGHLVPVFVDLLDLEPGDSVVEFGCGPGGTTARLATLLVPGRVVAIDRHRAALDHLRTVVEPPEAVDPVVADIEALPLRCGEPTPAMVAFVLHHVDDPAGALTAIGASLPVGSPLLVAEYDPAEPGTVGPPRGRRLAPATVRGWLEGAGFHIETTTDLPEEAYAVRGRRTEG